jgi:hypothetical protein
MTMPTEVQQHPLLDGTSVAISRNGNHQYWVGDGSKLRSVTSILKYVEGDTFGIGMNWALKVVREMGGDVNAPRRLTKESLDIGNALHEAVDGYIRHGTITEEDPVFLAWFQAGQDVDWVASERFLYHPQMAFGGTVDALSKESDGSIAIHDWKTVDKNSWDRYADSLRRNKDWAQVSAYAAALSAMNSLWGPITKGYITYIMRDGSGATSIQVDLARGMALFKASRELFLLTQGDE